VNNAALLTLIQLTSPALPVGAYSYSEGLESLVEGGWITSANGLDEWLRESLATGSIALEAAILLRAHRAWLAQDLKRLTYWNDWLSANRETMELQNQNWQMGRSLLKLLQDLYDRDDWAEIQIAIGAECNLAIAFAIAAGLGSIDEQTAVLGYLHSWASNLVSAGVKLIPLGQTAGQRLVLNLGESIVATADRALILPDDRLFSCSWGLSLASMAHETQYSRLFRS
jgi:urease accessory protein